MLGAAMTALSLAALALPPANAKTGDIGHEAAIEVAGRQLVRTPFIYPYDIRMIPLIFEGAVLLPEGARASTTWPRISRATNRGTRVTSFHSAKGSALLGTTKAS